MSTPVRREEERRSQSRSTRQPAVPGQRRGEPGARTHPPEPDAAKRLEPSGSAATSPPPSTSKSLSSGAALAARTYSSREATGATAFRRRRPGAAFDSLALALAGMDDAEVGLDGAGGRTAFRRRPAPAHAPAPQTPAASSSSTLAGGASSRLQPATSSASASPPAEHAHHGQQHGAIDSPEAIASAGAVHARPRSRAPLGGVASHDTGLCGLSQAASSSRSRALADRDSSARARRPGPAHFVATVWDASPLTPGAPGASHQSTPRFGAAGRKKPEKSGAGQSASLGSRRIDNEANASHDDVVDNREWAQDQGRAQPSRSRPRARAPPRALREADLSTEGIAAAAAGQPDIESNPAVEPSIEPIITPPTSSLAAVRATTQSHERGLRTPRWRLEEMTNSPSLRRQRWEPSYGRRQPQASLCAAPPPQVAADQSATALARADPDAAAAEEAPGGVRFRETPLVHSVPFHGPGRRQTGEYLSMRRQRRTAAAHATPHALHSSAEPPLQDDEPMPYAGAALDDIVFSNSDIDVDVAGEPRPTPAAAHVHAAAAEQGGGIEQSPLATSTPIPTPSGESIAAAPVPSRDIDVDARRYRRSSFEPEADSSASPRLLSRTAATIHTEHVDAVPAANAPEADRGFDNASSSMGRDIFSPSPPSRQLPRAHPRARPKPILGRRRRHAPETAPTHPPKAARPHIRVTVAPTAARAKAQNDDDAENIEAEAKAHAKLAVAREDDIETEISLPPSTATDVDVIGASSASKSPSAEPQPRQKSKSSRLHRRQPKQSTVNRAKRRLRQSRSEGTSDRDPLCTDFEDDNDMFAFE